MFGVKVKCWDCETVWTKLDNGHHNTCPKCDSWGGYLEGSTDVPKGTLLVEDCQPVSWPKALAYRLYASLVEL